MKFNTSHTLRPWILHATLLFRSCAKLSQIVSLAPARSCCRKFVRATLALFAINRSVPLQSVLCGRPPWRLFRDGAVQARPGIQAADAVVFVKLHAPLERFFWHARSSEHRAVGTLVERLLCLRILRHGKIHSAGMLVTLRTSLLGRQYLSGKVSASQLEGWVYDPQPLSELP